MRDDSAMALRFHPGRCDEPPGCELLAELIDHLDAIYPGRAARPGSVTTPEEMVPPHGIFLVGYDCAPSLDRRWTADTIARPRHDCPPSLDRRWTADTIASPRHDCAPSLDRTWTADTIARPRHEDGRAIACGGLRRLQDGVCEIKRMYVVPDARSRGVGRALLAALEDAARELGYSRVRLDAGPEQRHSRVLFASTGYVEIAPYNANHIAEYWAEKLLAA